jgi:hypothetical protein
MQQIAEYSLWALLGALAYTGIHMTIVEIRASRKLEREALKKTYTHDYSGLDRLDGLVRDGVAQMREDQERQRRSEHIRWMEGS